MTTSTDQITASLNQLLGIKIPIILAPMFLVSNTDMVKAAIRSGATGAIPALNYRTSKELEEAILELKNEDGPFGINIIVNKSNIKFKSQLEICCRLKVDFIITSLGSPEETIKEAHKNEVKVFCDVTDLKYAKKVESLGADAIIAVNKTAGGHAGPLPKEELIPLLKKECNIPVISAGGIGTAKGIHETLQLGADGLSMGSIFIATTEAGVSQEYKQACVDNGAQDIVMTTKLSGTPCTVINTPYVQSIGTRQNWLERFLNKNKRIKKWFKTIVYWKGMRKLKKAAFGASYKTVWCAGPSIEHVKEIQSVSSLLKKLVNDYKKIS